MASEAFDNIIAVLAASPVTPANTIDEIRAGTAGLGALVPALPGTEHQRVDAGGVSALWSAVDRSVDDDGTSPVVLHFHGGGYVMAGSDTHVGMCSHLAQGSGGRVLSVDYRLAPEDPFPAATDDAFAAYSWLLDQGVAGNRIVVAGDSAGGGLALGLLLRVRDAGLTLPAGAALMSPWVDLTGSGDSLLANASIDPILSPELLAHWATLYAGDSLADPAASPLYADLSGLPPVMVQVGAREVLYDDGLRLVERLLAANGTATFAPWDEMTHWWQLFAGLVPEADQALADLATFVTSVTG